MKYIELYEFVVHNKRFREQIKNLGSSPLYHAIKSTRAIKSLENDELEGYSIQRYWTGGKRYKDDHPEYEKSIFMRGISTSRDIEYCAEWNDIIFVFDKDKLKNGYKIVPYNWGYSIGKGYRQNERAKREREEFVITGYSDPKDYTPSNEYDEDEEILKNRGIIKMTEEPKGSIFPLHRYLIGFFISKRFEEFLDEELKNKFKSSRYYLGIYEDEDYLEKQK